MKYLDGGGPPLVAQEETEGGGPSVRVVGGVCTLALAWGIAPSVVRGGGGCVHTDVEVV